MRVVLDTNVVVSARRRSHPCLEAGGTLENAQAMAAHESLTLQSSMTAPAMKSPWIKSGELQFEFPRGEQLH